MRGRASSDSSVRSVSSFSLESLWQDVRYAARVLRRSPAFTVVAIGSLAFGIGANTAIFQLLDAVRLRSLPVPRPAELAILDIAGGHGGMGLNPNRYGRVTAPVWEQLRRRDHPAFTGLFAWEPMEVTVGRGRDRRPAAALVVSGELFDVLGVPPWRGRVLTPADETPTCPAPAAMVSYAYWQGALGGRGLATDTRLVVNGVSTPVVGVTPPTFFGLAVGDRFDIVLPYCATATRRSDVFSVTVMGRLRPGWTPARASAQLAAESPAIFRATAITGYGPATVERYKAFTLRASPAANGVSSLRTRYDTSLWLLLGITGLVLLIACANLASLMLARATARGREMALRLALGASRGRLLRQAIVESGLLALGGAALGVGLASVLSRLLVQAISTGPEPVPLPLAMDWPVLLFAAAVTTSTCAIFGLLPALRATGVAPATAMRGDGRTATASRERLSLRRLLVVTQVAVSLVLLVGALLFARSFYNLTTLDTGLRHDGVLVAVVGLPVDRAAAPPERHVAFQRQVVEDVRALPDVIDAATTTNVPLTDNSWSLGVRVGTAAEAPSKFTWVSPDYFRTMGMSLRAGRGLTERDTRESARVAVVNQTFVRQFVPDGPAIGRVLRTTAEPNFPATDYEIVGIVADTKYSSLRGETPPIAFAPASQFPPVGSWAELVIHVRTPAAAARARVEQALAAKYPEGNVGVRVFETDIRNGLLRERLMAMLAGFFGVLAALLAMMGLYGVMAYLVARRRHEIGIRLALGAGRGRVVLMVLREAGWLLACGIGAGAVLALIAGRGAGSLLFGLTPHDPLTLIGASLLLALTAGCASLLPARRAAALDPLSALREE